MNHSFNIDIAEKYGIKEAIIIENLGFWLKRNLSNNRNIHDGFVWSYNSMEALHKLFPYMSVKQIRYALEKLERANIIKSGNYNKAKYDRTKWYTIIDHDILQHYKIHLPTLSNADDQEGEPIPDINSDIKPGRENSPAQDKPKQLTPEEKEVEAYKQHLKQQKSDYPDDWVMTPNGSYRPPHAKDKYKQQEDPNPRQLKHVDFVKEYAAGAYETQIKMRYAAKIKDRDSFIRKFNNKCVIKEVPFKTSTILAEMENFAITWINNQK